jgi:TPP-dependent pyruvate/acetoin dehydrogenase alpha subunit
MAKTINPYAERPPVLPPEPVSAPKPSRAEQLALYRSLIRLRFCEKRIYDLFMKGLVKGTSHLSLGMEAIAAGFGCAMRPNDYTFATYRGHAHTLARGVPMEKVIAEMMGRGTGLLGGKGGSMHLTSVEHGVMGSYAIIGAHLPIACGAAWSAKVRGSGQVAVCFFGDGTTNIGAFHEALNLAALWRLPAVFVCENNLYMEYTPIQAVTSVPRPAADRACAYGLKSQVIDGNDADVVFAFAVDALAKARGGDGPILVEALTYRHGGHSRADTGPYRPEAEVDAWLARDPVDRYRERLLGDGVEQREMEAIDEEVKGELEAATAAASAAEPPAQDALMRDVWADGSATWRN